VTRAEVRVGDRLVATIGRGWLVLVGVGHDDDAKAAHALADKVVHLRGFADADGRMNLSALDVRAEVLVVSQFTLFADLRRGRRPYFGAAATPEVASPLLDALGTTIAASGLRVVTGEFGAMMDVELVNDGPVTLILER